MARPINMNNAEMKAWLETQYDLNERGCWVWKGCKHISGYGQVSWKNRAESVHRLYWLLSGRTIPEGLMICHSPVVCHNKACFNPDHLRTDSMRANMIDRHSDNTMVQAKLTANQIQAIRDDTRSHSLISIDYGMSRTHISAIKRGSYWTHI